MPPGRSRLVNPVALLYFVLATATLIWPLYPAFFDRIEPRVLGLPFSLAWILIVIAANFVVVGLLYHLRLVDDREHEPDTEASR